MKIIKVIGGLGNQMFQFALATSLKKAFPHERILLDLKDFHGYRIHNGFELPHIFNIDYQEATWKDIFKVSYPIGNYTLSRFFKKFLPPRKSMIIENDPKDIIPSVFDDDRDLYYDGYWQHEFYFKHLAEQMRHIYTFPKLKDDKNLQVVSEIEGKNSVSIHIRRGDYLTNPLFKDICNLNYYQEAIQYMNAYIKPDVYCVFSDDMDWCKTHLSTFLDFEKCIFIDWNKSKDSYIDMQLISMCKHNIIANSTFSWWGAWLNTNPDKTVIAPKKWINTKHIYHDPIPDTWLRL